MDHGTTPATHLGDESPLGLAWRLLDEITAGATPVWPTTDAFADRLADGLAEVAPRRGRETLRAAALAPRGGAVDWTARLARLYT